MLPFEHQGSLDVTTTTNGDLVDSFDGTGSPSQLVLGYHPGTMDAMVSQSWQSGASPNELTGLAVWLGQGTANIPRMNLQAHVFAHSGVFGTSSLPTGAPLVSSDVYAIDQQAAMADTRFFFALSGWTPDPTTDYILVLECRGLTATGTTWLYYGIETGANATHDGNHGHFRSSAGWGAESTQDLVFAVYEAGAGDTTPPTLSSPTGAKSGVYTGDGSVTTDEGNGTLYWVVTESNTSPSAAQVKAGQDDGGSPAVDSGSFGVGASGLLEVLADGLSPNTTYYFHYMHEDAAENQSTVSTSAGFTTDSLPAGIHLIIQNNIIDIIGIN